MIDRSRGRIKLPVGYFAWVARFGDDFGYMPTVEVDEPLYSEYSTPAQVMRRRVRRGMPIFSAKDIGSDAPGEASAMKAFASDPSLTTWRGKESEGEEISLDRKYTYRKWKVWDSSRPIANFIGLFNDPDVDPMKDYMLAMSQGCGGFNRTNLFSKNLQSIDQLWQDEDPIGECNDRTIRVAALESSYVVCCWGKAGGFMARSSAVVSGVRGTVEDGRIYWFGATKSVLKEGKRFVQPISLRSVDYGTPLSPVFFKFLEQEND